MDTGAPVYASYVVLLVFGLFIACIIGRFGTVVLAGATAVGAWLNSLLLYAILVRRDHYRIDAVLGGRLLRQLVATALMVAALWPLRAWFLPWFSGSIFERATAIATLVGAGALVYFGTAFLTADVARVQFNMLNDSKGDPRSP